MFHSFYGINYTSYTISMSVSGNSSRLSGANVEIKILSRKSFTVTNIQKLCTNIEIQTLTSTKNGYFWRRRRRIWFYWAIRWYPSNKNFVFFLINISLLFQIKIFFNQRLIYNPYFKNPIYVNFVARESLGDHENFPSLHNVFWCYIDPTMMFPQL